VVIDMNDFLGVEKLASVVEIDNERFHFQSAGRFMVITFV